MKLQSIPYFPFPSHSTTFLQLLEAKFKLKGFAVYIKLLQKIYGEEGYFLQMSDDIDLLLTKEFAVQDNIVADIITFCISKEIFDRNLYEQKNILTSNEIQKEYINAVKRRTSINLKEEYLLDFAKKFVKMSTENEKVLTENEKVLTENDREKENKPKEIKTNKIEKDNDEGKLALSQVKIDKFREALPDKLCDRKYIPANIDIDKLISAVKESPWVISKNNFTLNTCIKHYDEIIGGKYRADKPAQNRPKPTKVADAKKYSRGE